MSGINAPFRCSDGLFEHAWVVEDADKDLKVTSVETCAVCGGQRFTYVLSGNLRLKYGRAPKRDQFFAAFNDTEEGAASLLAVQR